MHTSEMYVSRFDYCPEGKIPLHMYVQIFECQCVKAFFMLFTTRVVCMCVGDLSLAVNFSGSVQNHDLNRRSGLWLAIRTTT